MKNAFVTYLGTDSFLPGVLTLNYSVQKHNPLNDFIVIVSNTVSSVVLKLLADKRIQTKVVDEIKNPNNLGSDERGFRFMYTKLRLFEMTEFDKVVYIDGDMLVCTNIEELFHCPHMSAVVAGSLVPQNSLWKNLNAGLLVIEPNKLLFNNLIAAIGMLPSNDGSDQGFLHSFYYDWPENSILHLNHKFNTPYCYLDDYCQLHNYNFEYKRKLLDTDIAIIHYWGKYKPWDMNPKSLNRKSYEKWEQSLLLWWDTFLKASK